MNAYGKTTTRLRRNASRLGLDVTHLSRVRTDVTPAEPPGRFPQVDPDRLRNLLGQARSWAEVLTALSLPLSSANYRRLKMMAAELDADISNLLGQAWASSPIRAQVVPFSRPADPAKLHQVGAAVATTWFLTRGYMVSLPVEPTTYDLIAESDDGLQRIQVKTTRAADGTVGITKTVYGTGTAPCSGKYGSRPYSRGELDLFFIYAADRSMYLVPLDAVIGMTGLSLKKYAQYRLAD